MIIWTGHGYLAAVLTFAACLLAQLGLDAQLGEGFYSSHSWAIGLALVVGGLLSSLVGFFLKARADRQVVDVQTGERLVINRSRHTFFFVPLHWAGVVIAVIGVAVALSGVVTPS